MDSLSRAAFIDFDEDLPNIKHWLKKNSRNWQTITRDLSAEFVIENYSSVKQLVLSGLGVATLPSYLIDAELKSGALMAPFPNAKPTIVGLDFALQHHKNYTLPLKTFCSHIAVHTKQKNVWNDKID
jgi:DNA-binding transcriptional LysR family regulator